MKQALIMLCYGIDIGSGFLEVVDVIIVVSASPSNIV
jgi:hypothetical protein